MGWKLLVREQSLSSALVRMWSRRRLANELGEEASDDARTLSVCMMEDFFRGRRLELPKEVAANCRRQLGTDCLDEADEVKCSDALHRGVQGAGRGIRHECANNNVRRSRVQKSQPSGRRSWQSGFRTGNGYREGFGSNRLAWREGISALGPWKKHGAKPPVGATNSH